MQTDEAFFTQRPSREGKLRFDGERMAILICTSFLIRKRPKICINRLAAAKLDCQELTRMRGRLFCSNSESVAAAKKSCRFQKALESIQGMGTNMHMLPFPSSFPGAILCSALSCKKEKLFFALNRGICCMLLTLLCVAGLTFVR